MSDPVTHRELDSALAAAEARTETRFVQLDAKIDRLADALTLKGGLLDQMGELRTQVRSEANTTRWAIFGAVVTLTVGIGAILVGITQIDAAHQANLLSAFQAALSAKAR